MAQVVAALMLVLGLGMPAMAQSPTVKIEGVPSTSERAFTATFIFSENVTGFALADITVGNGTASAFTGADGERAYTALITPMTNGSVTVDVAASVAMDDDNNGNTVATQATSTYTATSADDETPPTVTSITRKDPVTSPTKSNSLTWRVTFSEPVWSVDGTSFKVTNTTHNLEFSPETGGLAAYDVTLSGDPVIDEFNGTVTMTIDADEHKIADAEGNDLETITPTGTNENTFLLDNTGPTVTISGVPATSSAPFTATFTFSDDVNGFTIDDISLANGTASAFTGTDGGRVYTALITPVVNGPVIIYLDEGVAFDSLTNYSEYTEPVISTYSSATATSSVLVSNIGQFGRSNPPSFANSDFAQEFTTGTHVEGYTLKSVVLRLEVDSGSMPTVKVFSVSATGTEVDTLTAPSSPADGERNVTFTASSGVTLTSNTKYWIVAEGGASTWIPTEDGTDDPNPAAGWSIADKYGSRLASETGNFSDAINTTALKLSINGTEIAPGNSTGKPSITGAAVVGQTLTAATGTIADPDGLPSAFTYQWIRVDGQNETDISTATTTTYTLVAADQGKTVKVKVSFTDNDGNPESRKSDAYPGVGNVAASVSGCTSPTLTGRTQVWQGKLTVGKAETQAIGSTPAKQVGWGWDKFTGTLTNRDLPIMLGANRYKIGDLVLLFDYGSNLTGLLAPPDDTLVLNLDKQPTATEQADLRLHVCDTSFNFSDATGPKGVSPDPGTKRDIDWYWENPSLTWSAGLQRLLTLSATTTALATAVDPPAVSGTPAVSAAGPDGQWTEGEAVEVTVTFSEAVVVNTTGGTPSIGIALGGTEAKSAAYVRGTGTTALVFSYTLVAGDGSHALMGVAPDSLALNGGTIRGQSSNFDAVLSHNGAAVSGGSGQRSEPSGPTARFDNVPDDHNGTDPVEFELHFSQVPQGLSYKTVGGALLEVTGATVTGARRLTAQDNTSWEVSAQPSGNDDIVITLPNRACDAANAVCVNAVPLAAEVSVTIPGPAQETEPLAPFTASFAGRVPTEHDGSTKMEFEFHLSHNPGHLSYETVRDDLFTVTGGSIESASRRTQGDEKHMHWDLRVDPTGDEDVTITLIATTDCAGTPGVCRLSDNAPLDSYLRQTINGPATLSVADATVEEAEGATLDFVVTLSRRRFGTTTVQYATSDGTATEGSDYTATSGTLSFGFNETSKTVSVPVLDDVHDDGGETVTLTLSNPTPSQYVRISDGTATGTITNTDPMPKAWAVRFGRTVGSQVVDALTDRLGSGGATHVTVGGTQLTGAPAEEPDPEAEDPFALPAWANAQLEEESREISGRDLLLGTRFHLSSARGADTPGPAFTAWGRVAQAGFEAEEDDVTLDGDVTTGLVGFDAEWERALAGVMLSQSTGDGGYRLDEAAGTDGGKVESDMTGVYPYARLDLNTRVSAWAVAGVGSGELTLERDNGETMPTDLSMRMGALGLKGRVLDGTGPSGIGLNVRSDALWVQTKTSPTRGMDGTEGDVTRLRVILEGERTFASQSGGRFTPSAEVGLRHDGGDTETGAGLEVGVGARYNAGALSIEGRVRGLVAHEATGYEEWGASGSVQVAPGSNGRGLTVSIRPAWGNTGSASERLWSARDARGLGAGGEFEGSGRLEMEAGYGFGFGPAQGVLTPYAGATFSEGASRTMRTGARWQLGPDAVLGLEGSRQESGDESSGEVRLRAALRF